MNTNCLEGMRCPACGSEGPFVVEITTQVLLYDEGSEDYTSDTQWDSNSYMRCNECEYDDDAKAFWECNQVQETENAA